MQAWFAKHAPDKQIGEKVSLLCLNQNARDADKGVSRATVMEGVGSGVYALPDGRPTDITPSDCPSLIWFDLDAQINSGLVWPATRCP